MDKQLGIELNNVLYEVILRSWITNDTLKGKWSDEVYGSPIVVNQKIIFYKDGIIQKEHNFPIKQITKLARRGNINAASIPIFDVCMLHSDDKYIFYTYGADFCNGIECPEFIGLYELNGEVIYEGISTELTSAKRTKLLKVIEDFNIDLNKPDKCVSIIDIWEK